MATNAPPSHFVRGYIWANARFAKKNPISGPDWVSNTVSFGKKVVAIGVVLLVLCIFLPHDWRRFVFVGIGLVTVAVGVLNQRNAQAIFDVVRANEKI